MPKNSGALELSVKPEEKELPFKKEKKKGGGVGAGGEAWNRRD